MRRGVKKNSKHTIKKVLRNNRKRSIRASLTWLIVLGYLVYIFLILMTRLPFMAEQYTEQSMPELIESHLYFNTDGKQSHYYIERVNSSAPARIDVFYYPQSNTLRTTLRNVKLLTIYCRSMYNDECKDVFGIDPSKNSNYYKWFFIEKNHLNVNINSDTDLEVLKFVDAPKPNSVMVNGKLLLEPNDYEYLPNQGIAISNVSAGSSTVDIYFKPNSDEVYGPIAKIVCNKMLIQVNEELELDGSSSYDTNPEGNITNYLWDFGDGNFTSGEQIVNYKYSTPGVFGIILTVVDDDYYIDQAYYNVTVTDSTELQIRGTVPNIILQEDSPTFTLDLRNYEPYSTEPESNYFWYITDEDSSIYSISGKNSSDDCILITPNQNRFGNDQVWLWLEELPGNGNRVCQKLWINITPVNDPPTIFGIPDITIRYEVPYTFNYFPYVRDVDTPIQDLVLNSSDPVRTTITGLNVTYTYPQSMVGDTVYVILTIWDGNSESSDVVAVWITDDWVPNLVTPLPDVYLDEGEVYLNYFDLDDYFMDPDNDTLYYSYGYTHVDVIINTNHSVDFYAPEDWNGKELTTFRATDPSGALVEDIISVVVRPINDPPIIQNIPNIVLRYNQDYIFDVSPYIYDEDNTFSELSLSTSDPEHIRIDENHHLTIILNYPYQPNIPYTATVTLTVTDGIDSSFQIITVYVNDNYPPVLVKPFKELILYEDEPKTDALNLNEYFEDSDGKILYFRAINNEMITIDFHVDGSIDIGSAPNWSGSELITFRAEDPDQAFAEGQIVIKVLPVNDPPVIYELPNLRFNQSESYKFDLYPYIFDTDNNITQLQIWLDDCEIDHEIHGTHIIFYATKPLTTTLTIHVSDGQGETTDKFLVEVTGEPEPKQSLFLEILILILIIVIMVICIVGVYYRNYKGNFDLSELFLIYQNGCLILHLSNEEIEREETDADIISAMFTAVQDFTRDSFAKDYQENENWALKKLEFHENIIMIDRGKYLYVAVIFTGRSGRKLGLQLKRMRSEIETKYADVLDDWSGEMDVLDDVQDIVNKYGIIAKTKLCTKALEPENKLGFSVGTYQTIHPSRKRTKQRTLKTK